MIEHHEYARQNLPEEESEIVEAEYVDLNILGKHFKTIKLENKTGNPIVVHTDSYPYYKNKVEGMNTILRAKDALILSYQHELRDADFVFEQYKKGHDVIVKMYQAEIKELKEKLNDR